ncbi:MAG: hypothetical protein K2M72_07540 [Paramuribaculum sp.]|nr:hypothetical protein [Paramuribaculum sp.]
MKKLTLILMFLTIFSNVAMAQAKKPKLMIIPSRTWFTQNNYMTNYTDMSGNIQKTPDFQTAFDENADISMIIGAMQDFMNQEGYKVEDLKGTLAKLQKQSARDNLTTAGGGLQQSPIDMLNKTAKADINVELFYTIKKDGPYKYLEFNVSAVDAYSNTPVSTGNIGRGTSASSTDLVNQLEEAVLSFKDKFISDMDRYYARLFENGRQIVVRCTLAENSGTNYEEEYEDEELGQLIENWISDNAFKGNYSLSDKTENEINFDEVRIPMTYVDKNGNTKGADANWFCGQLRKYIESVTGEKCKIDLIGLGEANIILGGKS